MTEQTPPGAGTTTGIRPTAPPRERAGPTSGTGWVVFASVIMVMVGLFNVIFGLVALFRDDYYLAVPGGLLLFDLTAWGWVHLIVGAVAVAAGLALLSGATWARVAAVLLAGINALAQLTFLAAYPTWSLIAIALDVVVIWAVLVHGREIRDMT
ncbi:MAG TPA: hypothetical protein VHC18_02170 [Amycolatopsis sp.]|nr:hypothetical protein [Amycolatopsis sp.]